MQRASSKAFEILEDLPIDARQRADLPPPNTCDGFEPVIRAVRLGSILVHPNYALSGFSSDNVDDMGILLKAVRASLGFDSTPSANTIPVVSETDRQQG